MTTNTQAQTKQTRNHQDQNTEEVSQHVAPHLSVSYRQVESPQTYFGSAVDT